MSTQIEDKATERLFPYGTLQTDSVQVATFGRRLDGEPGGLAEYSLKTIQIQNKDFAAKNGGHQRTVEFTGAESDFVEGVVFKVSRQELEQADAYEPAEYGRRRVQLKSGVDAWVYLRL